MSFETNILCRLQHIAEMTLNYCDFQMMEKSDISLSEITTFIICMHVLNAEISPIKIKCLLKSYQSKISFSVREKKVETSY